VLPETPIAPKISPEEVLIGTPPGNEINPAFECSMPYKEPPGCEYFPISPVFLSKNRAVLAFAHQPLRCVAGLETAAGAVLLAGLLGQTAVAENPTVGAGDLLSASQRTMDRFGRRLDEWALGLPGADQERAGKNRQSDQQRAHSNPHCGESSP
jgi:hypothetical protein